MSAVHPRRRRMRLFLTRLIKVRRCRQRRRRLSGAPLAFFLYLAVDLIECQGAIRALSSSMSSPTKNAQTALRHLLKYLLDGQHHGLMLCRDNVHCGRSGELSSSTSRAMCIESYSDADWATHKGNRRSVSSSMVFVAGCLLYSSARTQRVIALSSGEAELLSATSSLCDALLCGSWLPFCVTVNPRQSITSRMPLQQSP